MSTQVEPGAMELDAAERIVGFVGHQDGVLSATVAALDGALLASVGAADATTDAALAQFICERAEALGAEGDLRGMGKVVSGSAFEELTVSGHKGEALVVRLEGGCLMVAASPGNLSAAAQAAAPVINRFGRGAGGR